MGKTRDRKRGSKKRGEGSRGFQREYLFKCKPTFSGCIRVNYMVGLGSALRAFIG